MEVSTGSTTLSTDPDYRSPYFDNQTEHIRHLLNQDWYSIQKLAAVVGGREPSVSALVRNLRKPQYGGYKVERRRLADGLSEYRIPPVTSVASA